MSWLENMKDKVKNFEQKAKAEYEMAKYRAELKAEQKVKEKQKNMEIQEARARLAETERNEKYEKQKKLLESQYEREKKEESLRELRSKISTEQKKYSEYKPSSFFGGFGSPYIQKITSFANSNMGGNISKSMFDTKIKPVSIVTGKTSKRKKTVRYVKLKGRKGYKKVVSYKTVKSRPKLAPVKSEPTRTSSSLDFTNSPFFPKF